MGGIIDHLDQVLGEGTHHSTNRGSQYSYCCPICNDHKNRLFVHPDRKVVHCHNCTYSASIVTLISDMSNISWKDALSVYREYDGYEFSLPDSLEQEIYERLFRIEVERKPIAYDLPEEFTLIEDARGDTGKEVIKYLRSRGVSLAMAERYYIGYCAEGKYENRIIMPDFEDGELIYWQARTILPTPKSKALKKVFRKVLNPSLTKEQIEEGVTAIDKSEIVGNIDFVLENRMAVLCEGRMDSYTIGDIGCHLHGKVMSDTQFMKLVRNKDKIDCIAIMLDGDAFDNALVIADRLYKHFDDILISKIPYGEDPNSIGRKKALEYLKDALPYTPMFGVKARLRGWI